MSDLDSTWNQIAAGTGDPALNPHVRKLVLLRARHAADQSDESSRREALHVLRRLGGSDAMAVASSFCGDPSVDLRRRLLAMGREAGADGSTIVRKLASDQDAGVAVDALQRLVEVQDRGASTAARALLSRPEPSVRAAAASYLGAFGGVPLVPVLRPLLQDADPTVAAAARGAITALEGRVPGGAPHSSPAKTVDEAPPPPANHANPKPNEAAPMPANEAAPTPAPAVPPVEAAPPALTAPPVQTSTGREVQVPTKVLDVFHHLASYPDRRAHLIEALRKADERELSEAFRNRKPGHQADLNLGAAIAAADLGNARWLAPVRKLASDPDARVRAAVATALGALCTPAVLNALEELVYDADPAVHLAALQALVAGARRVGAVPSTRKMIQALPPVEDESLKAARASALAELGT